MRRLQQPSWGAVCYILTLLLAFPGLVFSQKNKVAILYDQQNKTLAFTAAEMKSNFERAGQLVMIADIKTIGTTKAANRFVLVVKGTLNGDSLLVKPGLADVPPLSAQGYAVRKQNYIGYNDWYIIGYDNRGVLYGGLDVSETVKLKGFAGVNETEKQPFISSRGIKFNIPLDARTPSYSDNSDAAQQNIANMWDVKFWHEFLDEMARDRFNMLSLWSLSPFPSLVDVPEYPNAGLQDVKKTTSKLLPTTDAWFMSTEASLANLVTVKKISLADKIKFWKDIMQYASDRGIDTYLFTWNLFTYGTEHSGYGFTDKISDDKTKDYIRKATRTMIQTYPLLKGIGLTAGENMYRLKEAEKEKFLFESYGEGINEALAADASRSFKLIHRAHQADIEVIRNAFANLNPACTMDFSYKYSVAQMYSSVAPRYIYDSKFLEHIGDSKFYLTVRDDAWYNLRGGSDPAFARAYFKNIPQKNFEGFYVGPDGYTWGREYLSKTPSATRQQVINKRWYSFNILGKLAYDPTIPDSHFTDLLADRYTGVDAKKLQQAWAKASQVMPWVNRFHNEGSQNDFQWYPEGCTSFYGFRSIDNFINSAPQKGEGLVSIPLYADAILNGQTLTGISPLQVAANLQQTSNEALLLLAVLKNTGNKELLATMNDIRAMSYLGQYYANKIAGATNKHLYHRSTEGQQQVKYKTAAIQNLKQAAASWRKYAAIMSESYIPQHLTRMHFTVDFKAMQAHVDKEVLMLTGNHFSQKGMETKPPLQQLEVVFSNHSNYYFWHLDKMGLPNDWSGAKYLVMEVFATTKQPFDLVLEASGDTLIRKGITPKQNGWIKVIAPLQTFRKHTAAIAQGNTFLQPSGTTLPMTAVAGFGVLISKPLGYPVLEIRSVKLLNHEPAETELTSIRL